MTEAGVALHHCPRHHPLYRLGGVCVLAVPSGLADGPAGVAVSWAPHNLILLDWDRYGTYTGTQQAMNTALGGVLRAFGYSVTPCGPGGAGLVTGRRDNDPGAGR